MGPEPLRLAGARIPGDPETLWDVVLCDGVVASVHPADTASGAIRSLPADGRYLLPGLWDSHVHLGQWAQVSRRLDLSSALSAAEVLHRTRRALQSRESQDESPLLGYGFRDAFWPDVSTLAALDDVTGAVPTVLVAADLHCCWINSAAARRWATPSPRDGMLREGDCFRVQQESSRVEPQVLDSWSLAALDRAVRRGVVGVVDYEMAWNVGDWQRRQATGLLSQRVECGIYPTDLDRAIALGLCSAERVDPERALVTVGSLKIISDGSLNTRTAYCHDAYTDRADAVYPNGVVTVEPGRMLELVARAHAGGLTSAIHAIGDRANTIALDIFQTTGAAGSIEHAQLLRRVDVVRMAALGILASVQPEHAMDDRDIAERLWAGQTDRAFPFRALRDAGVRLALGSDAPVSPLDPWQAIAAAVLRSRGGREPWHPEQSLTVTEAIDASTRGSGHSVRVGQPADVILVDHDPLGGDSASLRTMPVAATVCAGRILFETVV
ncbi:amidohydrolase family protein [Klugiella xanthotipulae]|uniref:Amidohydrolase 3 domain-containing protein n=1 Tax=Klugiella xanthotipulae TaxID=244735 RepID=A0A543HSX5_9MICO|nr:amidohydrolase family protein [Klugiella xanthotipulae]TQM61433.1 hypothetical protein FB466_2387 [Klugiella xanthotipulae]